MKNILKDSFKLIRTHFKLLFVLLLIQLIFFIVLMINSYLTLGPAIEHLKRGYIYISKLDIDNITPLGEDPLILIKSYKATFHYLKLFFIYSFIAFIILNGLNWALTHYMIKKLTKKEFFKYLGRFSLSSFIYISAIILISFSYGKKVFLISKYFLLLPIIIFILFYFMLISFATNKNILESLIFSVKKAHLLLPIVFFNVFIISLSFLLVYISQEFYGIVMLITIMILLFSFVWTRLFLILIIKSSFFRT